MRKRWILLSLGTVIALLAVAAPILLAPGQCAGALAGSVSHR
jgi:hypothetical protein